MSIVFQSELFALKDLDLFFDLGISFFPNCGKDRVG